MRSALEIDRVDAICGLAHFKTLCQELSGGMARSLVVAWRVGQKPPHANVKKSKRKLHWFMLFVISCGNGKLSRNRKSTTDGELNPKSVMHGMTPGNRWVLNRTASSWQQRGEQASSEGSRILSLSPVANSSNLSVKRSQ